MLTDSREKLTNMYQPHPARTVDAAALLWPLQQRMDHGLIRRVRDAVSPLFLYCYTNLCQIEGVWDKYTLMSRGLVIDYETPQVLATPFPKFFNYGEVHPELIPDHLPKDVQEKVDGSLGVIFFDPHWGWWRVVTKGSFASEQARWAQDYLDREINTDALRAGETYCVEIVYPENRIVVDYQGMEGLVLLGGYDAAGYELAPEDLDSLSISTGFYRSLSWHDEPIWDVIERCKTLSKDEEGYVLRYSNGFRLKIKGDEYVRVHRLISKVTPLGVWRILRAGDSPDKIRRELPEEMRKDFDNIVSILLEQFNGLMRDIRKLYDDANHMTDKEVGMWLNEQLQKEGKVDRLPRKYLFSARNKNLLGEALQPGPIRDKLFDEIRPKENKLEGYVPSNSMNRFNGEVNNE